MGGGANQIFTAGTELRPASQKGVGGRAGERWALGHCSVSQWLESWRGGWKLAQGL